LDYLRQYVIHFSGLSTGNHQFEFEIGTKFFESIEYSELSTGDLEVTVEMEKEENLLRFDFHFEGSVDVQCDRCGDDFSLPLQGSDQLIVKYGDGYVEEDDNILIIPHSEHQINISHFIYEMIILSLPFQRIHPLDNEGNSLCDPEQIRKLEEFKAPETTDPRWDSLRGLLNEN
jgi:uncharacterized protein